MTTKYNLAIVLGCMGQSVINYPPLNVAGISDITEDVVLACSIYSDGEPDCYMWKQANISIFIGTDKQDVHEHSDMYELGLHDPELSEPWTNYNLVVRNAILGVAGKYQCVAHKATTARAYADVLLLGAYLSYLI